MRIGSRLNVVEHAFRERLGIGIHPPGETLTKTFLEDIY
jgi:hypothetical protein